MFPSHSFLLHREPAPHSHAKDQTSPFQPNSNGKFLSNSNGRGLKGRRSSAPPDRKPNTRSEGELRQRVLERTRVTNSAFSCLQLQYISRVTRITGTYGARTLTCEVEFDILPVWEKGAGAVGLRQVPAASVEGAATAQPNRQRSSLSSCVPLFCCQQQNMARCECLGGGRGRCVWGGKWQKN